MIVKLLDQIVYLISNKKHVLPNRLSDYPSFSIFLIRNGTLPKDWSNAHKAPTFKTDNWHLAENYQPVTLTSDTCKIQVSSADTYYHFDRYKTISSLNHDFRSGYSCEIQLIIIIDDFKRNYKSRKQTGVAILDFSKASDTALHKELLAKMPTYAGFVDSSSRSIFQEDSRPISRNFPGGFKASFQDIKNIFIDVNII